MGLRVVAPYRFFTLAFKLPKAMLKPIKKFAVLT